MITINGIKIFGIPWVYEGVETMSEAYKNIPSGIDIIVSHAPPLGYGDIISDDPAGRVHSGLLPLLELILRVSPQYHLFGHVHESYGIYTNDKTVFINASTCTRTLQPTNPPIVFDIQNNT